MRRQLLIALLLCTLCACPTLAITRWFTSTFNDLKWTLYRFGHCYAGLGPISSPRIKDTQYVANQMKTFLDQANFGAEQLYNISALMDRICLNQTSPNYAVSLNIDVQKYNTSTNHSMEARCQVIDDAMDSMYHVFKRAALNHSEPIDFNSILFYANASVRSANTSYNVIDLINVAWIQSQTEIETVCAITNPFKEYVEKQIESLTSYNVSGANRREDKAEPRFSALLDFVNRLLDPILGLQRRLYWESSSRLEQIPHAARSTLISMRDTIGSGGRRVMSLFSGSRSNSTLAATNATKPPTATKLNGTQLFSPKTNSQAAFGAANSTLAASSSSTPATTMGASTSTAAPSRLANMLVNATSLRE